MLRLCPAPWTAGELTAFARSADILIAGLASADEAAAGYRHDLFAVLEALAPTLQPVERATVADAVRALPPEPSGSRSTLTLLRGLGAVLVRSDLEQALASARLGADPWQAETAVLRDAFTAPHSPAAPAQAGDGSWRAALDAAVRAPDAPAELRRLRLRHAGVPGSRDRLEALIGVYASTASAASEVRAALVDWMTDIQPLDAPAWTFAEAAQAPTPHSRTVHVDDLDQPRSAVLRERLLTMLDSPPRTTAAPPPWRSRSGPSPGPGFPYSGRSCEAVSTYPWMPAWPGR